MHIGKSGSNAAYARYLKRAVGDVQLARQRGSIVGFDICYLGTI